MRSSGTCDALGRRVISGKLTLIAVTLLGSLLPTSRADASLTLSFSDFSSDSTPATSLTAAVEFTVLDSQLQIVIVNTSAFKIARLYFNSDPTLTGLEFNDAGATNRAWRIRGTGTNQNRRTPFGKFNWYIRFGHGHRRLAAGSTTNLVLDMTKANGVLDATLFVNKFSMIPPGNTLALGVIKFEAGPRDDSAFGAAVPEPSVLTLTAFGATVGLLGYGWRRRRKAD